MKKLSQYLTKKQHGKLTIRFTSIETSKTLSGDPLMILNLTKPLGRVEGSQYRVTIDGVRAKVVAENVTQIKVVVPKDVSAKLRINKYHGTIVFFGGWLFDVAKRDNSVWLVKELFIHKATQIMAEYRRRSLEYLLKVRK